jgi:hypothetical protein
VRVSERPTLKGVTNRSSYPKATDQKATTMTNSPITLDDLSTATQSKPLSVLVDGAPAQMFASDSGWSDRVVLLFAEPHEEFGSEFQTKYFEISTPGTLTWGHENRNFSISIA